MLKTSKISLRHFLLLMAIAVVDGLVISNHTHFNTTMATSIELNSTKELSNLNNNWTIEDVDVSTENVSAKFSLATTAAPAFLEFNNTIGHLNGTIDGPFLSSIAEESVTIPAPVSHLFILNNTANDTITKGQLLSTSTVVTSTPKSVTTAKLTATLVTDRLLKSNNVTNIQPIILTKLTSRLLSTTMKSTTVKPTTTPSIHFSQILKVKNVNEILFNNQTTETTFTTTKATIATTTPKPVTTVTISTAIPTTIKINFSSEIVNDSLVDNHPMVTSKSTSKLPSSTTSKPARRGARTNLMKRLMLNSRPYQQTNAQPVVYEEPVTMIDVVYDDMVPAFDIGEIPPIVTSTKVSMPSFYIPTPPPWLAKELTLTEATEQSTTTKKLFLITIPPLDSETTISDELFDSSFNNNHGEIIPVEATSAIIISGIIGGCAIAFFSIVMALCIWRQHKSRRPIYPTNRPMLPTTSMTSINSQKSIGLFER